MPNVFTPNGDQTNSYFQIFVPGGTLDDIALLTMKIYSRWGNLVYDNDTPDTGWDGTYKGEPCPMDVYAYVIEVEYVDGRKEAVREILHWSDNPIESAGYIPIPWSVIRPDGQE